MKEAAIFLSGLDQWYPYDVSMNIVHSFHHTRIHEDCERDEVSTTNNKLKQQSCNIIYR